MDKTVFLFSFLENLIDANFNQIHRTFDPDHHYARGRGKIKSCSVYVKTA